MKPKLSLLLLAASGRVKPCRRATALHMHEINFTKKHMIFTLIRHLTEFFFPVKWQLENPKRRIVIFKSWLVGGAKSRRDGRCRKVVTCASFT